MKRIALLLSCVLAFFAIPARAQVSLDFKFFHDSLEPYGEWASVGDYGYVWHPNDVDEDWAPYTDGYWAYTDAGWTWVSYEDWGGIAYHYGRWIRTADIGWCWVPDYEWGPAWVSWRSSDDYIGWAPLPPEACWVRGTGFSTWVDVEFGIGPACYRFCRAHDFGAPVLRNCLLPCHRNWTFINQTVNITNVTYRNDRHHAFNGGPDYHWIAARSNRPVPALKLIQNTQNVFINGNRGNVFVNSHRGNTLVVGAPPVAAGAATSIPKLAGVTRSIPAPQIDRGWSGVAPGAARDGIIERFRQDAGGRSSKTGPAAAFDPARVAMIPGQTDVQAKPSLQPKPPIARPAAVLPPVVTPGAPPRPTAAQPSGPTHPGNAPSAQQNPAALSGGQNREAAIERQQRQAAAQDAYRRQAELANQAARNQQRAAAAQSRIESQPQQPAVAARPQPTVPKAPAPEGFRRPVEAPRQAAPVPSFRPGPVSPQDIGRGKGKAGPNGN